MYSKLYKSKGSKYAFFKDAFFFAKEERLYVIYSFNKKAYYFDILAKGAEFYQFWNDLRPDQKKEQDSPANEYLCEEIKAVSLLTHGNKTVRNFARDYKNEIF